MPSNRKPQAARSRSRKPTISNRSSQPHELQSPRTFPIAGTEIVPDQVWRIPERHPRVRGPWIGEPDRLAWTDAATGYACLVLRARSGTLSGYVAVPAGHPLWGFEHDAIPAELGLSAHGGISYSQYCDDSLPGTPAAALRICHTRHEAVDLMREADPLDERAEWEARGAHDPVEEPRLEPGKMAWWLGFDTDKPGDLRPIDPPLHQPGAEAPVYRDIGYVFTKTVSLARQLHALADAGTPLAVAPPPHMGAVLDTGAASAASGNRDPRRSDSASPTVPPRQNPMLPGRTGGTDDQA